MSTPADQTPYEVETDPPLALWRDVIDAMPWTPTEVDNTVLWYLKQGACPHCIDKDGINASLEAEGSWVWARRRTRTSSYPVSARVTTPGRAEC